LTFLTDVPPPNAGPTFALDRSEIARGTVEKSCFYLLFFLKPIVAPDEITDAPMALAQALLKKRLVLCLPSTSLGTCGLTAE